ncbi:MAG: aminopeptidase P N-terminal domain-containing protein [Planctomycetes bacterium]|nr:aminopeptidase P N-terminal domain-containing protein [Planctomycetota bacterium]
MPASVYAARRARLLRRLGAGVLVLPTAPQLLRNGDVHHAFRPASDFHYLTGFPEPESVLVAARHGARLHTTLFVRPRDPERETWDGKRYGVDGARRHFGVDEAQPIAALWKELPRLVQGHARLFHTLGRDPEFDRRVLAACAQAAAAARRAAPPAHPEIVDPLPALGLLRLVKDRHEQAALARAADISAAGHRRAMHCARPGMREYEVQAAVEAEFRRLGSRRNGYESIVASGPNACILHYHDNDRTLRAGDLLLLDAGAELGHHTADITRTFPVSGRFTPVQRRVYEIVLRAQVAAVAAARSGASWQRPHEVALRRLTAGLVELGVLRGRVDALVAKKAFRPWYMHGTSHWLGMDVHDVGPYQDVSGRPTRLRPGMVLTVEPGLYFPPGDRRVPRALRGIGVRIEDDVLVTARGPKVLTAGVPKTVAGIEALCAAGR